MLWFVDALDKHAVMSRKRVSREVRLQRWFGWLAKGTRKCLGISRKEREQETSLVGDVTTGEKTRDYVGWGYRERRENKRLRWTRWFGWHAKGTRKSMELSEKGWNYANIVDVVGLGGTRKLWERVW